MEQLAAVAKAIHSAGLDKAFHWLSVDYAGVDMRAKILKRTELAA